MGRKIFFYFLCKLQLFHSGSIELNIAELRFSFSFRVTIARAYRHETLFILRRTGVDLTFPRSF